MKVSELPFVALLIVKRDGSPGSGEALTCGMCGSPKVQFLPSRGLRAQEPSLPEHETVCVKSEPVPCLMALRAKRWLDVLKRVSR